VLLELMPRGVHSKTATSRKSKGAKLHRNYLIHNAKYDLTEEDNPFVSGGLLAIERADLSYRSANQPSFWDNLKVLSSVIVGVVVVVNVVKALISNASS
jgi:hypothetical protein